MRPWRERFAVQEDGGHGHDLARLDLVLEQGAVDGDMADLRVEHAHQVQRLHHVGAVLAGQREIGLEVIVAVERLDLLDRLRRFLGRMAADLQQGEDQRIEFMAHRQAGESARRRPCPTRLMAKDGLRASSRRATSDDLVRLRGDVFQQRQHFLRLGAVVERGDQFDRLRRCVRNSLAAGS